LARLLPSGFEPGEWRVLVEAAVQSRSAHDAFWSTAAVASWDKADLRDRCGEWRHSSKAAEA
jgi:hypothetical protein